MKHTVCLLLVLLTQALHAQAGYIKKNEELVFSFETPKGKKAVLAKDKHDKYLVYRFGTKDRIELEYPGDLKDSWSKFKYAYYFRGGGKANAGLEIENITFENGGYKYIIYLDYSAEEDRSAVGVVARNIKTDSESVVIGDVDTVKGSLMGIRESGLLEKTDELY